MTMPPQGYPGQGPQQGPQQRPPQGGPPGGGPPGGGPPGGGPGRAPDGQGQFPAQHPFQHPFQHPPQQYQQAPPRSPAQRLAKAVAVLALVSLVGIVLGLSIKEDGHNGWDSVNAWGGLAIVGAALTGVPAFGHAVGLGAHRAWQLAACGAGALILFWVLFTLPDVGSNTSLLATIGVAAGVIAVWIAPGRPDTDGPEPGGPPRTW